MELFQLVLAILTVVTPIFGGLGYALKKYSDGKYYELETRQRIAAEKSASELEQVKADTAQAVSASESIKSLTGTLVTMVEERRESTVATKENTAALNTMSVSMDGLNKDRGEAVTTLTVATTGLTTMLSQALVTLTGTVRENTQTLKEVASGQDELEDLYKALSLALEMVFHRLKTDNRKFAEYMLRPTDASKQGIEDIASGKHDEPNALPATAAVTA